jgi:hypothetical protein
VLQEGPPEHLHEAADERWQIHLLGDTLLLRGILAPHSTPSPDVPGDRHNVGEHLEVRVRDSIALPSCGLRVARPWLRVWLVAR